jgi:hypothetical protein
MGPLPEPRGPISAHLLQELAHAPHPIPERPLPCGADPLSEDDLQLALYLCYELHYRGLDGVDDRWEWEPSLLSLRGELELSFERALLKAVPPEPVRSSEGVIAELRAIADGDPGSLASYLQLSASAEQLREFLVHRSAYHLKEADPHSWAIPRLTGGPKAALVEVQADEYGGGRAEWIHAELFARSMRAVGLDGGYNAYLDLIPGMTLSTVNLMSLFGLHRRLRGAIVGHLALFEMTSSIPNRRIAHGIRRLGFDGDATLFFDEHVEADAVHENIAAVDLAGGLAGQQPELAGSILWGARTLAHLGDRWGSQVLECWRAGGGSLLRGLSDPGGAEADQPVRSVAEGAKA